MDMIGKELKIIKSGKVYGVLIDGVDKIIDFCEQETQNLTVRRFALNMDQNSTLDVSKKLFRKRNQNWKLILNEN